MRTLSLHLRPWRRWFLPLALVLLLAACRGGVTCLPLGETFDAAGAGGSGAGASSRGAVVDGAYLLVGLPHDRSPGAGPGRPFVDALYEDAATETNGPL